MTTICQRNDLSIYERHAKDWWNPRSHAFRSLHRVNEFRSQILGEWLGENLADLSVVDLGCGGGLLAEALARRGARVTGLDIGRASVQAASDHVRADQPAQSTSCLPCFYLNADMNFAPLRDQCADVVLLADVLEHVVDYAGALSEASRLLRPRGKLYVNTINRTRRAHFFAVTVAEGLGLVPKGTHDSRLFITPQSLVAEARLHQLRNLRLQGESARLMASVFSRSVTLRASEDLSVAYSALFEKDTTL